MQLSQLYDVNVVVPFDPCFFIHINLLFFIGSSEIDVFDPQYYFL
jgi:hypothetical protein